MVIGGGIAGIQASLDLAESGIKVYLVERNSAIGGHMAQLDKTFPTNDCAMCIISPKLAEAGRHLNIDILTNTQVEAISGEAGNFQVTVRRQPRYVDMQKCTACGECTKACPVKHPQRVPGRPFRPPRGLQALPAGHAQRLRHRQARHRALPRCLPHQPARPGLHRPDPRAAIRRCLQDDSGGQPVPLGLRTGLQPQVRDGLLPQPSGRPGLHHGPQALRGRLARRPDGADRRRNPRNWRPMPHAWP